MSEEDATEEHTNVPAAVLVPTASEGLLTGKLLFIYLILIFDRR